MRVLGLTTSTARGGAALVAGDRVVGASGYVDLQGHAERIFAAIDAALAEADRHGASRAFDFETGPRPRPIDAIACDVGPGSFTGVRVGIASAKGIALALGVPIVGVGSLEALAEAAFADGTAAPDEIVFAAIDAKKSELFVALYDASLVALVAPRLLARDPAAADALLAELAPKASIRRVGEWPDAASPALPDARSIARIAAARLAADPSSAGNTEAVYVRAPDAKLPGT
jgi:tRNA threonylcarbamoyladenosine biosynthesis protein TsaB